MMSVGATLAVARKSDGIELHGSWVFFIDTFSGDRKGRPYSINPTVQQTTIHLPLTFLTISGLYTMHKYTNTMGSTRYMYQYS